MEAAINQLEKISADTTQGDGPTVLTFLDLWHYKHSKNSTETGLLCHIVVTKWK